MKFGYFDDKNREYVITRPDTPRSWSNYLGDTNFGSIISNNAGGYSFYRSGGMGRFIRMRFNAIPMDQPGRYIYFRDMGSGDYWSASWQPTGKPLAQYRSECRHGMGYTRILSEYSAVVSEATWFVPRGKAHEVWNAMDDLLNIQYVQYTDTMKVHGNIIDHGTNIHIPEMPDDFAEKDQGRHSFQAMVGLEITGFDTDREAFLGPYRTYANPLAVEQGSNTNSEAYGDNPCGSLSGDIHLRPGESSTFLVITGVGKAGREGREAAHHYRDIATAIRELDEIREYWKERMAGFSAETPDPELNSTVNVWGIYNALITYAWSRSASFIYSGKGEDSVFGHMKRAIQFNLDRSGSHGLPCGLKADWNDCLRFGHDGESVFVAMQLRLALKENGGIFMHTQGWGVMAEAMMGHNAVCPGSQTRVWWFAFGSLYPFLMGSAEGKQAVQGKIPSDHYP